MKWKWKLRNNRGVLEDFKRKYERRTSKRKERKEKRKKRREKKKRKKEEKQKKKRKKRKKKNKFFSLPSKTMGCFSGCLMSAASDLKLFCKLCSPFCCSFDEFAEEKVISPSYSFAVLTPPLIIWFLSFSLLTWCITLIDLHIMKNPCIPGINPAWSWCMSFLMKFCWGFFSSMFISDIGL